MAAQANIGQRRRLRLVLTVDGNLIFKTEYGDNDGNLDCYVLASGEKSTVGEKNDEQMVRPIILEIESFEVGGEM